MMLAETVTNWEAPAAVCAVIGALYFLMCCANEGIKFFGHVRGKEPNPELMLAHDSLKDRVQRLEGELTKISHDIAAMNNQLQIAGDERARRIHNRLNPIADSTSEMKGMMEAFTLSFQEHTKVMVEMIRERKHP